MSAARGNVSIALKRGVWLALVRAWDHWTMVGDAASEQAARIFSAQIDVVKLSQEERKTYLALLQASRMGVTEKEWTEFLAFIEEWEGCEE